MSLADDTGGVPGGLLGPYRALSLCRRLLNADIDDYLAQDEHLHAYTERNTNSQDRGEL